MANIAVIRYFMINFGFINKNYIEHNENIC